MTPEISGSGDADRARVDLGSRSRIDPQEEP